MKNDLENLLNAVASALQSDDPRMLGDCVAPWMDADDFVSSFLDHQSDVLSVFDYSGSADVEETNLDDGDVSYEELTDDVDLPAEVTAENFRHWAYIQFVFEEDAEGQQAAADVWVAVVEEDGALQVGHYVFGESN
jgi:hypothetical protein